MSLVDSLLFRGELVAKSSGLSILALSSFEVWTKGRQVAGDDGVDSNISLKIIEDRFLIKKDLGMALSVKVRHRQLAMQVKEKK